MIERKVGKSGSVYFVVDGKFELPSLELAQELVEWREQETTPFDKDWVTRMFYLRHELREWID